MRLFLTAMIAIVFAGCSGGGQSVKGTVTFSDGSPLKKGIVNFNGDNGSFRSSIGEDGTYSLEDVEAGEYTVIITGAQEGGEASAEMEYDEDGNPIEQEAVEPKSLIHKKYSNPNESDLKVTVPGDYDLKVDKPS